MDTVGWGCDTQNLEMWGINGYRRYGVMRFGYVGDKLIEDAVVRRFGDVGDKK